MVLTFTSEAVRSDWHFVDTILDSEFSEATEKHYAAMTMAGEPKITAA